MRDVIARVEELEGDPDSVVSVNRLSGPCADCGAEPNEEHDADCDGGSHSIELAGELKLLTALLEDLAGNGGDEDWRGDWYPLLLVRDSHFRDFAQQEAEDLDLVKSDARWPYTCIDWTSAAEQLKQDYSIVEFDGITYWYR